MKFRKKPVIIDAEQYRPGLEDGFDNLTIHENGLVEFGEGITPFINTLEGKHYITEGDWIITGVKGERYPIKNEIFLLTYEPVE